MTNFSKIEDETVQTGGIRWTWKTYRSKELFFKEGVWISARIYIANSAQVLVSIFILIVGVVTTISISNSWITPELLGTRAVEMLNFMLTAVANQGIVQNAVNKLLHQSFAYLIEVLSTIDAAGIFQFDCLALSSYLLNRCNDKLTNATDFACNVFMAQHENLCESLEVVYRPVNEVVLRSQQQAPFLEVFNTTSLQLPFVHYVSEAMSDNVISKVNKLYPTARYMVTVPTTIATVVAVLVSISLAAAVIPSHVSTILKLRSGVIPTFRDDDFYTLHYQVGQITKLTGGMFWSNIVAVSEHMSTLHTSAFLCVMCSYSKISLSLSLYIYMYIVGNYWFHYRILLLSFTLASHDSYCPAACCSTGWNFCYYVRTMGDISICQSVKL
jgi:hypothetical protein